LRTDSAVYQRQRGRAVAAGGVERAAGGIERLVEVVRGRVGGAVGPQQLGEALAVHATVGRQREDLDQRLGLAQPPRTIGDDLIADGDRETAQQADARLGAAARGSPLADETNSAAQVATKSSFPLWGLTALPYLQPVAVGVLELRDRAPGELEHV
jgi:hypothetical protein